MCNCENHQAELCEAYDKEYEAQVEALREYNEYLMTSSNEIEEREVTQEEMNDCLLNSLKEDVNTFTDEQKNELRKIADELCESAKDRVIQEATELGQRIEKLHKFLKGYNDDGVRYIVAAKLTDAMVLLMQQQEDAMTKYYNCLVARLSIWDAKAE